MYKLTIINQFNQISVINSDNLDRLKLVAQRLNKQGCSVEITKEVVLYRNIQMK